MASVYINNSQFNNGAPPPPLPPHPYGYGGGDPYPHPYGYGGGPPPQGGGGVVINNNNNQHNYTTPPVYVPPPHYDSQYKYSGVGAPAAQPQAQKYNCCNGNETCCFLCFIPCCGSGNKR